MINLVLKDIKSNKDIILIKIIIPMILGGFFLTYPYLGWDPYFMLTCMITVISGSIYPIREKYKNVELLTCSLPVSRNKVIYSKYLTAFIITISGISLWGLNAYLADLFWVDPATQLYQLFNLKALFTALFFISVSYSLYLPSIFLFKQLGMIIFLCFAIIISIFLSAHFLMQSPHPFHSEAEIKDVIKYIVLFIIMIILPIISISISKIIYNQKDI